MPGKADDYIVKSEFNIAVYLLYIILIAFAGIGTFMLLPPVLKDPGINRISLYIIIFSFTLFDLFAFIHPLISCYNVFYDGEYLLYKWTFIPRRKKIHAEQIEGYYTMKVPSREDEYLTAYPACGNKLLPAISSFYFDNYSDIVKDLPGDELARIKFSWSKYFNMAVLGKKPE